MSQQWASKIHAERLYRPACGCQQEPETLAQNRANWTIRFGKPDGLVSSVPVAVRGTVGSREGILLPAKWCLSRGGTRSMTTQGVVAVAKRSK
jgi:hypothetical protein